MRPYWEEPSEKAKVNDSTNASYTVYTLFES